jgi:hypothetical protein
VVGASFVIAGELPFTESLRTFNQGIRASPGDAGGSDKGGIRIGKKFNSGQWPESTTGDIESLMEEGGKSGFSHRGGRNRDTLTHDCADQSFVERTAGPGS